MLYFVVPILLYTGIRPGNELLNLKWKNLSVVTQDGKESIQFSVPISKTKQRVVIGYEPYEETDGLKFGCWSTLDKIRSQFEKLSDLNWEKLFFTNEYIFRYPNGERVKQEQLTKAFRRFLTSFDDEGRLSYDDFGNARTLYSLRHTYASQRCAEGMSFDDLSVQMGTSVKILE